MSCDPSKVCQVCDQRGLPILPLRYAVARADVKRDKAPQLSAPFGAGVEDIALPAAEAHYTLRLLRGGYLYVFNEMRGEWKAYAVNEDAYLTEFDIHSKSPPDTGGAEPCERMQNSAAGRCVMIPDAKQAGTVWLGFSDVAWTSDVLARHSNQAWREKHMQRIDVGAWASSGSSQPHLDRLARISELVSEYAIEAPKSEPQSAKQQAENERAGAGSDKRPIQLQMVTVTNYPALDFSLQDYRNQQPGAASFIDIAVAAANELPPAMVALHDPVGVTADLASLVSLRFELFMRQSAKSRELMVSAAIGQLEMAIKEDAENRKIYQTEREARQLLDPGFMGAGDGAAGARGGQALADWLFPEQKKAREKLFEHWRNPSPKELREARGESWRKYENKYDESKRRAWQKKWESRARTFDQGVIAPLAEAHTKWMSGEQLCDKLDRCCDDADVRSGDGFIKVLSLCIQDTQQFKVCFDLYHDWMNAPTIDRRNLILRGLAYNQKQALDQLAQYGDGGLNADALKGLPWEGLIQGYEKSIEALGNGGKNAVVTLTAAIGGPISKMIGNAIDGAVGPGLISLGLVSKAPVVLVEKVEGRANVIAELITRMSAINGKVGTLKDLNRAIDIEMRKAQIYGTAQTGTGKFRYLLIADAQVIADFPGDASKGASRQFAEKAILTEADRSRLTKLRWKKLMPTDARLGIVTSLFQLMAWRKMAEDLDTSMAHERTENTWRYVASVTAMSGTITETVGKWSESATGAGNRAAIMVERYLGKAIRIGGKALGIGAGAVMAVWDGMRGGQEIKEGNVRVGVLYIASAGLSIVAMGALSGWFGATMLGVSATGVGIVLVVLVIVIAVLIEVFKDNKIQDWLERCYFGKFEDSDRYKTADFEMKELEVALQE